MHVLFETNKGNIKLELYGTEAPITVENFVTYVKEGHYDGTVFHRVIDNFMIQGGGYDANLGEKSTHDPITNEATNGLANDRGTIAMARTPDPHSASAQFFINVADNTFLNHRDTSPQGFGYCVFGKVVEGMDVVDKIKTVKTGPKKFHQDVPVEAVIITKATVVK
ncbi:MAG: peptidyl-prolyl cis-trans isomerase [Chlamydiia bacterium]|nr:peptidyl-prolyl cis-trans isomerase [Chlamydiia bacterium]